MGTIVQFPGRTGGQLTAEMRSSLARFTAKMPGTQPLVFGKDGEGSEFCYLANGLLISCDRRQRLVLTDTLSGYVDTGPFDSLDEIYPLIAYLT